METEYNVKCSKCGKDITDDTVYFYLKRFFCRQCYKEIKNEKQSTL